MNQISRVLNRSRDYLFSSLLDKYWREKLLGKVMCLLYHRVDRPDNYEFMNHAGIPVISPHDLEFELRFLAKQGAIFLTFSDLRDGLFPDSSDFGVIISFDDCFLDNYTDGLEVLENLGIKGVFLQSTAMVDATDLIWEHALYWFNRNEKVKRDFAALSHRVLGIIPEIAERSGDELIVFLREHILSTLVEKLLSAAKEEYQSYDEFCEIAHDIYATSDNIKRVIALGHEVGSHGHRHYKRENIDVTIFEQELLESICVLEKIVGEKPKVFSYPFNSYHQGDERICAKHFLQVATVDRFFIDRETDPLWMPRFSWPGPAKNRFRQRRWLFTGKV
jgi:peptidoglycan/xylan/chitin deacetylase (PgdA/CDA1 family)